MEHVLLSMKTPWLKLHAPLILELPRPRWSFVPAQYHAT